MASSKHAGIINACSEEFHLVLEICAPVVNGVVDEEMSHAAVALNLATFCDGLRSDDRNFIAQDTVIQIAAGRRKSRIFQ